jgi:transcriptional regulator with XRE-family HTH domain
MNLQEARRFRNISQQDLAGFLNITQGAVSHWEMSLSFVPTKYHKSIEKILGFPIDFESKPINHATKSKRTSNRKSSR